MSSDARRDWIERAVDVLRDCRGPVNAWPQYRDTLVSRIDGLLFEPVQAESPSDSLPEWHPVPDNFAANWLTNGAPLHPLTVNLVVRFARALAAKLATAEQKYGYSDGWRDAGWMDECRVKLNEHIAKGDPRDVAAYCAFLWHHGESTAAAAHPEARAEDFLALIVDYGLARAEKMDDVAAEWFAQIKAAIEENGR